MLKVIAVLLGCSVLFSNCSSKNDKASVYVAKYKDNRECAISYTYDDGMTEHYTLVFPEMEKRGMKGTFWVNGASVNFDGKPKTDIEKATWLQFKEMADNGHEISNHGWSHANLTQISIDEAKAEIRKNDSIILTNIGMPSRTFCYPYNATNKEITALASEGRVGTRLEQEGIGTKSTPESLEAWVNSVRKSNDWGVAMIHGITCGYDALTSADILWNHFDQVAALKEYVWVGTFHEVAAYLKEVEMLSCEIVRKGDVITVIPHLDLDRELYNQPLTMVVEEEDVKEMEVVQGENELPVRYSNGKAIFDFNPYGGDIEIEIK